VTPTEYDHEPIRGLPGDLPPGEHILWQGAPEWRTFAASALFTRWIGVYFAALAAFAVASGQVFGALATVACGAAGIGLLSLFAVMTAKTTVYTITNRRVVLRIGVALTKCINLPLKAIAGADLRKLGQGRGDIALSLEGQHRLGYAMLWPHARPFRFGAPQPMLRALADVEDIAAILAKACSARMAPVGDLKPTSAPALKEAAA
jgi:hypothetical protein